MLQGGRQVILCDTPWRFRTDPEGSGLVQGWPQHGIPDIPEPHIVSVPHTWNVDMQTEEYRGTGWYEFRFSIPGYRTGNRVWVHFEGVYRDTTVWINGMKAGSHLDSGYTPFRLELTPYLHPTGENRLVVSVDNRNSESALPRGNHFDWADDGGIIRDVSLIVSGEVTIDYPIIRAIPVFLPNAEAAGEIEVEIVLSDPPPAALTQLDVDIRLMKDGRVIWSGRHLDINPNRQIHAGKIRLPSVDLWHFDHPHLYELELSILDGDRMLDRTVTRIGFREFRVEGNKFWLNREPVRLVGVEWMPGSHPDVGMAETDAVRERYLTQLKEANCVYTRFHWQQDEKLLDWCDRHGMLVQEEIPIWQQPAEPGMDTLPKAKDQAAEMISRHANHPCIIAWGMGNELDGQSEQTVRFMELMKAYIKSLDSRRLVNYVSNTVHLEPGRDATKVGDALMWNDYIGTWHGDHDMDEVITSIVSSHPDKPVVVAEFGLCEPAYPGGDPKRVEILREKMAIYRNYPGIAGLIFFSLNDYRTQMGEDGEGRLRQRIHGTTDLYGAEKPSYAALCEEASPIRIKLALGKESHDLNCLVECKNDIPAYSIQDYRIQLHFEETNHEYIRILSLSPGDSEEIHVPFLSPEEGQLTVSIERPTGFCVLKQRFQVSKDEVHLLD